MPRRLIARLQANLELPCTQDGIWSLLLSLDETGPWTAGDVCGGTTLNPGTPRKLIRRWKAAGYVEQVGTRTTRGRNPQQAPLYRLRQRPAEAPRVRQDGSVLPERRIETMWRAMKVLKVFTAAELATHVSEVGAPMPQTSAYDYAKHLERAGVLVHAGLTGRSRRFRLAKSLGARAPKILEGKSVFDPNSGAIVGTGIAREVSP